jgi:hypothetical protein
MKNIFILSILILSFKLQAQICFFSSPTYLGGKPTSYSGDANLDQKLSNEYFKLVSCFGVRPFSHYIFENGGANAFASPVISDSRYPDGTVVLGLKMIQQECSQSMSGTCVSMAVVMAHEFAHILDYKNRIVTRGGKKPELFADYMAGVYLHTRELTFSYTNIKEAAIGIFGKGDYAFNDPLHHGTPQERMNALLAGYNFSRRMVASGRNTFTIQEAIQSAKTYLRI